MIAIILNSGMGTRLKELTKNNPKSLVKITENETIFSRAIKILSKFDIDKFNITTGYLNIILENYANNFSNISFKFIHNAEYETTNYIKSIDLIPDIDDDVILLHGDLIFSEEVAEKIINSKVTTVVTDSTIPLPKDDFKAKIMDNQVKCFSTKYFDDDAVACQPFYKIKKEDWKIWINNIREFCMDGKVNVYAENALTDEITITPTDIKGDLCQEIDTVDDLNRIKELIK